MVNIFLTGQAKRELKEIKNHISFQSSYQASRVVDIIMNEIKQIPSNPSLGRPVITTETFIIRQYLYLGTGFSIVIQQPF